MEKNDIKKFLKNSRKFDSIASSYIIYGGKEEERIEIAFYLACLLNCENLACGNCEECIKIKNKVHPDVKWIKPEKSLLSIDEVRWVKEDIFVKPYSGKAKVYIFQINHIREEAANSFLKILEEPPDHAYLLILSESLNFFLPTITSRCHKLKLNYTLSDNEKIAQDIKYFYDFLFLLNSQNYYEFFKQIDNFVKEKEREGIEKFLDNVLIHFRDILLAKYRVSSDLLIDNGLKKEISPNVTVEKIEKIAELKNRLKYNINLKLAMEILFFSLLNSK